MGKLILVAGENNSGKSAFAEKLICKYPGRRYYIATMIPATDENRIRIRKHIERRAEMDFTTLEISCGIKDAPVEKGSAVLLEDVSNLLVNTIFVAGGSSDDALDDIRALLEKCDTCLAVTIDCSDWEGSDEGTLNYIKEMNSINKRLEDLSDIFIVMKEGNPVVVKGEIPDAF